MWWYMLVIPGLSRQRQADLFEFQANLVYMVKTLCLKHAHTHTHMHMHKKERKRKEKQLYCSL